MPKPTLNKAIWTQLSNEWGILTSPDRPSIYEMEIHRDYVEKIVGRSKGKIKALILGATPEFRDMLAKYDVDVTLVDINPDMIKAMDQLLEYSDGKEKVVISNWLEIPLESNSFDMIICDQGVAHIPFEKWETFFAEQARLLKKDGHLIKNIITIERSEIRSVQEMINAFKNNIFSREDKIYYHYLCVSGLKDYEGKKHFKYIQEFNDELEIFRKKGVITKEQFEFLKTPWGNFKCSFPPKEVVDEVMGKYFTIKSIRSSFINNVLTCYKIYFGQVIK